MGTKDNPGKFDCYHAAKPDEPMFVLLARDPLAPFLVSIWASVRMDDLEGAFAKFNAMIAKFAQHYHTHPDVDKASEAIDVSLAMFKYYLDNSAKIRQGEASNG